MLKFSLCSHERVYFQANGLEVVQFESTGQIKNKAVLTKMQEKSMLWTLRMSKLWWHKFVSHFVWFIDWMVQWLIYELFVCLFVFFSHLQQILQFILETWVLTQLSNSFVKYFPSLVSLKKFGCKKIKDTPSSGIIFSLFENKLTQFFFATFCLDKLFWLTLFLEFVFLFWRYPTHENAARAIVYGTGRTVNNRQVKVL